LNIETALGKEPHTFSCACAALRRANRAVTQLYDLVLAPSGLRVTQFIALRVIQEAGEIAQCDFAREYAIAVETLSRRLGGLRRKGLIQVRMGDRHGERIYSLTDRGRKALNEALPFWERAQSRLQTTLGGTNWRAVLDLAPRICIAAQKAEQLRTVNPNFQNLRKKAAWTDSVSSRGARSNSV
jgi:DNA-binding MarR family transcriptional regulator